MFTELFNDVTTAGVPILLLVIGLVQWAKITFSVKGKPVKILSMVVGTGFGLAYNFSTIPPVDFSSWFAAIVFGLALGLTASGIYEVANPPQAEPAPQLLKSSKK